MKYRIQFPMPDPHTVKSVVSVQTMGHVGNSKQS